MVDKRYFQGLPSPAAAALVAGFVWLAHDNKIPLDDYGLQWVAAFFAIYGGLTMVSSAPFYSFKDFNFRKSVPFWAILLVVLGFVLVSFDPPIVLFLLFCAYGLSGYVQSGSTEHAVAVASKLLLPTGTWMMAAWRSAPSSGSIRVVCWWSRC